MAAYPKPVRDDKAGHVRENALHAPPDAVSVAVLHPFAAHGFQGASMHILNRALGVRHKPAAPAVRIERKMWRVAVGGGSATWSRSCWPPPPARTGRSLERLRRSIRTFVAFQLRGRIALCGASRIGATASRATPEHVPHDRFRGNRDVLRGSRDVRHDCRRFCVELLRGRSGNLPAGSGLYPGVSRGLQVPRLRWPGDLRGEG